MRIASALTISCAALYCLFDFGGAARAAQPWITYPGGEGPGKGKRVVLVSGDEEYRSEETLPQLAKILSRRHGFQTTVLFSIDSRDGTINPIERHNIPGLEALGSADLLVLFTRFRDLPDEQMQHLVNYIESGRPIVALRTATHAFDIPKGKKFAQYSWNSKDWDGGFGRQVLGETWIRHHGQHGKQSARGIIAPEMRDNPIVRGIGEGSIWGPTDVYGVRLPLPRDCRPLVLGQVLEGMHPDDKPVPGKPNNPMMPVAWTARYKSKSGRSARVFVTTMGASQDFASVGVRRMLVNACYWAAGLEHAIPPKSDVELVGPYRPTRFGFGGFIKGVRPPAHALEP